MFYQVINFVGYIFMLKLIDNSYKLIQMDLMKD